MFTCLATTQQRQVKSPRDPGVVSLHVNAGHFSTTARRVTSPTWDPPPPCKQALRQCSVPEELSGHDGTAKQKAERGCSLLQSKLILEATEKFVPVGSGKQMFYVLNISGIYARVIQMNKCKDSKHFYIWLVKINCTGK